MSGDDSGLEKEFRYQMGWVGVGVGGVGWGGVGRAKRGNVNNVVKQGYFDHALALYLLNSKKSCNSGTQLEK